MTLTTQSGTAYPAYWPSDGWSNEWGQKGADDDVGILQPLVGDGDAAAKYMTAKLSRTSSVGKAICTYLARSAAELAYTSQKREATRMERARWQIKEHDEGKEGKQLTAKQLAGAEYNLKEGSRDGPAPPRSGPIDVRKIKLIRNDALWDAYVARREELREALEEEDDPLSKVSWSFSYDTGNTSLPSIPVVDAAVGETLLFHGTSREVMKLIADGGFKPDIGRNKGTDDKPNYGLLGQGSYFSDNFAKVMTYTACRHCLKYRCECEHGEGRRSKRVALLSRVLLGHPKKMHGMLQAGGNLRGQTVDQIKDGRHSVYAKGTGGNLFSRAAGSNEFLVKRAAQIYPEFVIYWVHDG